MYKVVWLPSLTNRLAALFMQAVGDNQSKAMTRAVAELDKQLKLNPKDMGESRDEGRRIVFQKPVAILFEIVEDENLVIVVEFHYRSPN